MTAGLSRKSDDPAAPRPQLMTLKDAADLHHKVARNRAAPGMDGAVEAMILVAATDGPMMSGYPIWKRGSYATRAARKAPTFGRTSTGIRSRSG